MKVTVTVNGAELSRNIGREYCERDLRAALTEVCADWLSSSIFVAHFPGRGRYLTKSPGYASLSAGG